MQRLDFSKSKIYWDGTSKGLFKLVSALKVKDTNSSKEQKNFALGESVLAGNMYVSNSLLKKPPYLFQIAGSVEEQYIFRTFLSNKEEQTIDTWRKPSKEFYVDIKKTTMKVVKEIFLKLKKHFFLRILW